MSLWGRIKSMFGRRRSQAEPLFHEVDREESRAFQEENVRRWDSAQTHRLNKAHWSSARSGNHINDDLACHLKTLRARCTYEASNNPWVAGVIRTHSIDVITPSGPTLVVESSNDAFNRAFKKAWDSWWSMPDIAGELSGVDLLRRWNKVKWIKGPIFAQFVSDPQKTTDSDVSLRIRDIDPDRLDTPYERMNYESTQFGVQRSKVTGRPAKFFVRKGDSRTSSNWTNQFDEVLAENALFAFVSEEADQATGYPLLATCLEEIAQLRDYDTEVMDAARQFANNAMAFYTEAPEFMAKFGFSLPTGAVEMKRGTGKYIYPGYKPMALNSTQPAANYKEFRFEKLRSLGRPVSMPLLLILLSAEESNFSQSRIDVNVFYERGLQAERFWWESHVLKPILMRFMQELRLATRNGRFVLPPVPSDVSFSWHWEAMPQADAKSHYETVKLKRELGITTWSHDVAAEGKDRDSLKATIERDKADLEEVGLTLTGEPTPEPVADPTNSQTQQTQGATNA